MIHLKFSPAPVLPVLSAAMLLTLISSAIFLASHARSHMAQGSQVHIGPGGQLIIGGFDPSSRANAERAARDLENAVPNLKSIGVTSHEGYVRWNLCEPERGKFDWRVYDRFVGIYKKNGLKWVPFLIVGSAYSLPDWYYKKPESQGYVCLEHGQESDVQSLWNPNLRKHVARFIQAFCDHYRDSGVIEGILLGITGNYGEAIYPVSGNDWTADIHGPYHSHPGFWAGDKYARDSFQVWLVKKYGGSDKLRDAWGITAPTLDRVAPFLRRDSPNGRAWLDVCDWYIGSMTDYARFWLGETRKHFPKGDIYLCTGGHAPPEHGSDFGEQCKAAAHYGAGVRITNEASDYPLNFTLTRWVASAGNQYGAYFSFEPAGGVDPGGVIARIYNATVSGARGLHYYYPNIFGNAEARAAFVRWGSEFKQRKHQSEIGVYYPETDIKLHSTDFIGRARPLRDRFDFDFLSDRQILDGGLKHCKALTLIHGNVSEAEVWKVVAAWVRKGGLVLYPDGMGPLQSVEGNQEEFESLFGPKAKTGKGRALVYAGGGTSPGYRDFVTKQLATATELSEVTKAMVKADGIDDNLFASICDTNQIIWYNATSRPIVKQGVTIPPHGIATQDSAK